MGFPVALAVAVARRHVARAESDDIAHRLRRLRSDPAWIEDVDPETQARLADLRDRQAVRRLDRQAARMRTFLLLILVPLAACAWMALDIARG